MPAPTKPQKRPKCRCCRHDLPHCKCKLDQKPRDPPQPVKTKPLAGSLIGWLNLSQIAFAMWKATGIETTVLMVSGAIRALQLGLDKTPRAARVKGAVLYRQQTMVHPSQLLRIQQHIQERYR